MIRQYYKLDLDQSKKLNEQFKIDTKGPIEDRANLIKQFYKEFNANQMVMKQGHLGETWVIGYEVDKDHEVPKWAKREFFYADSKKRYYLIPKRNFKHGKKFNEWLGKINEIRIPSFNNYVVEKAIGQQPFIIWGMARHYAVAGYQKDVITLSVPTTEENPVTLVGEYEFVQIKKSEYVAITED